MEKRLIPSDFDDDRIFYLHVDPLAIKFCFFTPQIIHELPSLFYRKYRPLLGEKMIVMDLNNNQIELSLCKGEDVFIVMKV
ncbi:uncharacterized protein DS421_9g263070 [Arachis hypogaea]|nr:uncharacterized protein DS421_9g263070 [Arachis hypogaea]